uniref:Uncharacterized protein n=1 Tax=Manihot esculenta TaxID=3983 RepID=A0A2C9W081_MANES
MMNVYTFSFLFFFFLFNTWHDNCNAKKWHKVRVWFIQDVACLKWHFMLVYCILKWLLLPEVSLGN